jgi:hypothetical protein
VKYVGRKMLASYTKFLPKNDVAAVAPEAGSASPRTPGHPAADAPRQKRGMAFFDDECAA